jgi:hypothetical protein
MILLADGWHTVSRRSFTCGSFTIKASDGQSSVELADAMRWEEGDDLVVVPRSSVLALKRRACGPREEVSTSDGGLQDRM